MHAPLASANDTNKKITGWRHQPATWPTDLQAMSLAITTMYTKPAQLRDTTVAMHAPLASANDANKNHWVAPPTIRRAC